MRVTRNCLAVGLVLVATAVGASAGEKSAKDDLSKIDVKRGIVGVLGLPNGDAAGLVEFAKSSELTFYVQSDDPKEVAAIRSAADAADLLGQRIIVDSGPTTSIHLSDNLADGILVAASLTAKVSDKELLRALRPRATAHIGNRNLVKPVPAGIDDWSHPYHGPDNNPQSNDKLARGKFCMQFIAEPKFSPMPEQTVIAGGRIYKAMGHIAHKENQNAMLNTLLCINAYNGTILWKRPLPKGFMIHRNTMIATDDALLLGDDVSCKVIDAETGKTRAELTIPKKLTDGPVWKWMALRDGVLYGLVGNEEVKVDTQKSARRGLGHWPWGMWKGHEYGDPRFAFGFGRTLVAIDLKSQKLLWHYRDEQFLDARALCLSGERIFCYSPDKFLAAIDTTSGEQVWKNSSKETLTAIGANQRAQHYVTGYATTCYMKCKDESLFFAGPQRAQLASVSTKDGSVQWTHPTGNLQLVLRDDAVYAAGPQRSKSGVKLDYATGKVLAKFPARRACTRATGSIDSIFYRASGGTVRVLTATNTAQHIAPMRPPCQGGVLISNGHLYWGPWMCGCQLSLYGNICLGAVTEEESSVIDIYANARTVFGNLTDVKPLDVHATDWVSYRGNNARNDATAVAIPKSVEPLWTAEVSSSALPTAPVVAGGMVFVADRTGAVIALDEAGKLVWKTYTAGPVYYPPAVANDRLYVGSADGRVYAMEARTGHQLWSFRVAPRDRWIPVYGQLISAWPVAGGVVVDGDTVYAAAGIAHFDGTYVVALDAVTGKLKRQNSSSGTLSEQVNNGISLQGNLSIVDKELRFLAGGVYETARYELDTLACSNSPRVQVNSGYRTAFYPYYPAYGRYVSLDHTCADGSTLCHDASYEGSLFTNLALQSPLPPGTPKEKKEAARWRRRGKNIPAPKNLWQEKTNRRFTSFVVSTDQLLATGHPDHKPKETFLAAINIKDGSDIWKHSIPAEAVKGGTAIDRHGRIYVSMEDGRVMCFAPAESN